ncbi:ParA family protein [Kineococcus sp. NUM-3379]
MKIVTIANAAGSAGKTTTVVTLAALLAEAGHRVLVMDADPQANATSALGLNDPKVTLGDVLLRRADLADAIAETAVPGLHLVPSSGRLDADAVDLSHVTGGEQRLRLALNQGPSYDVVLIDCPGAVSILTIAALVASTAAVTVAQPTIKEIVGLPRMEATVEEVRDAYNPTLSLSAVVPCIVPAASAGAAYGEAVDLIRSEWGDLVTPTVRRSVRVIEAYARSVPLSIHAPLEGVTEDYRSVLKHLTAAGVLP